MTVFVQLFQSLFLLVNCFYFLFTIHGDFFHSRFQSLFLLVNCFYDNISQSREFGSSQVSILVFTG